MRRLVQQVLHSLPSLAVLRLDRRLRPANTRRATLVSYLEASGYRTHNVDAYERSLRRRRLAKFFLIWATAFGIAWIVIESARAVTIMS